MAEKSLVNDETATVGAGDELLLLLLLLDAPLLLDVVELDDELPHAAMPTVAASTSAALTGLLFSKCTMTSSSFSPWKPTTLRGHATPCQPLSGGCHIDRI
jgi:hypothetical protein